MLSELGAGGDRMERVSQGEPAARIVAADAGIARTARASNGMVVTSHPLAAQAGLHVLRGGGNAADAAVATAAVLAVVEPAFGGLGGDAFALVRDPGSGRVEAVNGAGRAPALAEPGIFPDRMPDRGARSATVPAAAAVWHALADRYGTRSVSELVEAAIAYASRGFPVSDRLADVIARHADLLRLSAPAARTFLTDGRPPAAGEILRQPDLAVSLAAVAADPRSLYEGPLAERFDAVMREEGGLLRATDLAGCTAEIGAAISVPYRDWIVHEQPPPSQGFILLEELGILSALTADPLHGGVDQVHAMVEAKKIAFADRDRFAGDPDGAPWPLEHLLSRAQLAQRARSIDPYRVATLMPVVAPPAGDDTSVLVAADAQGGVVSLMQSVWLEFGSGVVIDGTGIVLNSRMAAFSSAPGSPNELGPGRRPVHTLNTAIAVHSSGGWIALGTPGGHTQVQTTFQVLVARIENGLSLSEAVVAPRWASYDTGDLEIEEGLGMVIPGLRARGHAARSVPPLRGRGWVQAVERDGRSGTLTGVSDPRWEGSPAGW